MCFCSKSSNSIGNADDRNNRKNVVISLSLLKTALRCVCK